MNTLWNTLTTAAYLAGLCSFHSLTFMSQMIIHRILLIDAYMLGKRMEDSMRELALLITETKTRIGNPMNASAFHDLWAPAMF